MCTCIMAMLSTGFGSTELALRRRVVGCLGRGEVAVARHRPDELVRILVDVRELGA